MYIYHIVNVYLSYGKVKKQFPGGSFKIPLSVITTLARSNCPCCKCDSKLYTQVTPPLNISIIIMNLIQIKTINLVWINSFGSYPMNRSLKTPSYYRDRICLFFI